MLHGKNIKINSNSKCIGVCMDFAVQTKQKVMHFSVLCIIHCGGGVRSHGNRHNIKSEEIDHSFSSFVNSTIKIVSASRPLPIGELKIGAGGEDIECARTVSAVDGFIAVRLMLMLGDVKVG